MNLSSVRDCIPRGLHRSVVALCLFYVVMSPALALDAKTEREINHLLIFIGSSQCEFFRNGTWHSGAEAADHIKGKYDYVLRRGRIKSTEDFIALAASKSSISGKAYKVRCGEQELTSAGWLSAELGVYRNNDPANNEAPSR